jgi:DNA-binding NarL/FixJ family response regulator
MAAQTDLRLLLATARPALRSFFASLGFELDAVAVAADAAAPEQVVQADIAAIDVALDPAAGLELCAGLHEQRPELPVIAVVCCPAALAPSTLRALFVAGARGVIDLRGREDDVRRTLVAAAGGDFVLNLQLTSTAAGLLRDVFAARPERRELQLQLLELVAQGLPDHEIGRRLHLSPHTVKHQIEQVRTELHLRNRIELAAWAGRNGFYVAA